MNIVTFLANNGWKSGIARKLIATEKVMVNNLTETHIDRDLAVGDTVIVLHNEPEKRKFFIVKE